MSGSPARLGALLFALLAPGAAAQDVGRRVTESDGDVAFRFATRPDVEVCEDGGVRMDGGRTTLAGGTAAGRTTASAEA